MNKGFFLIHRALWDKEWFAEDMDFEQQMIVINLVRLANWEPNKLRTGLVLNPGQLAISLRKFATKIKTTIQRLRTVLTICSNVEFATHETTHGYTVITIVNWDTYQGYKKDDNTTTNTEPTQSQHATNTDLTKNNKQDLYNADFERLWAKYPRKKGKDKAFQSFKKALKKGKDVRDIETALDNYLLELATNKTDKKYFQHGSTFFNQWEENLEQPAPAELPYVPSRLVL